MLTQVADGVWVRQSEWVWSNAIVVRADTPTPGLIVIDPGISGADLNELADDIEALNLPVVAGFATHPHWDHLLWHPRLGDVPRYATPACAQLATEARERAQQMAASSASDIPLELIALLTPLPTKATPVPGTIVEHLAHAVGHAAILLADRGVLVAGDMLSDVLIPLLDPRGTHQVDAYDEALNLLADLTRNVDVVIPGHGSPAIGTQIAARLEADRTYIHELRTGIDSRDPRLNQEWLAAPHQGNITHVHREQGSQQ